VDETSAASRDRPRIDPFKATLVLLLVCTTAVLCVLLATTIVVVRGGSQAMDRFGDALSRPQPTARVATSSVVVRALEGASELATTVYTLDTIVDESRDRTIGPWTIGNTRLLYVAHGQVKGGVDLSSLSADDVAVDDRSITVTLPPPSVLDAKIDVDKSFVYDLDRSLLGPIDRDLQTRAERYALRSLVAAACESGVLTEANLQAETAVTALLEPLTELSVVVKTSPPEDATCGAGFE
jgi:hypothetical protein